MRDQDALLDAADAFAHVPYGLLLWESAVALARALARRPELCRGRATLELGCGVGLVGLVAAHLGARVLQTDHEPVALALAARNAVVNEVCGVTQRTADWRTWPLAERFGLVLGADVLYEAAMHEAVEHVLEVCVAPGGMVLLADPGRPGSLAFLGNLEQRGWSVHIEIEATADLLVPGRTVDVTLVSMQKLPITR